MYLEFGYDPHFRNVDQMPIHKNDPGSKQYKTITIRGSMNVPLIENHAATRERMSLSTVTDSNEYRIRHENLPGFEIMFKADGKKKEKDLQRFEDDLNMPFRISVVTSPSGSYNEEDLLDI